MKTNAEVRINTTGLDAGYERYEVTLTLKLSKNELKEIIDKTELGMVTVTL